MARERNPNRDKALEIYREHGGKITNREIANLLGEDEKVIAVWKGRDKWNVVQHSKKRCTTKKKGGQPGNKNAVGHGGTGPPRNKNAVTTGEFEALLFDCLDPEEKELAAAVPQDKEQLLLQEIQLLTVRERRMLRRIENLRKAEEQSDAAGKYEIAVPPGMTVTGYKAGIEKGKITDLGEYKGILGQIQSVEEALTRVQARKQRAIEALHKFGFDDARLKLESMRTELAMMKLDQTEEIMESDGFLEALNTEADLLWGDKDGTS